MAEYIEREATIEFVNQYTPTINGETTMQCVERSLKNVPSADVVEVIHSKWIKSNNERRCPICDFFYMTNGTTVYNLCPMCGAKMDGKGG